MEELGDLLETDGLVLWLTGAGISAESGIPTFRGEEGYWRVGSRNYRPQEMATWSAFAKMPGEVWAWYLYRRGVCRLAEPNPAHRALARLEEQPGRSIPVGDAERGRSSTSAPATRWKRTYQIHGNIDFMRCADECLPAPVPIPDAIDVFWERGRPLSDSDNAALRCPSCGGPARPHVLWFRRELRRAELPISELPPGRRQCFAGRGRRDHRRYLAPGPHRERRGFPRDTDVGGSTPSRIPSATRLLAPVAGRFSRALPAVGSPASPSSWPPVGGPCHGRASAITPRICAYRPFCA